MHEIFNRNRMYQQINFMLHNFILNPLSQSPHIVISQHRNFWVEFSFIISRELEVTV